MSRFRSFGSAHGPGGLDLDLGGAPSFTASPLRGQGTQGTFSSPSLAGGGVTVVESVSLLSGGGVESPVVVDLEELAAANDPSRCLFVTTREMFDDRCFGAIGSSGEKFCLRQVADLSNKTCGKAAHARKAREVEMNHIYYREPDKGIGFTLPTLAGTHPMAVSVLACSDEFMSRLHFKELVEIVNRREVTTRAMLMEARERIVKSDLTVSFTPRKKPRFGADDGSWIEPVIDAMPTITELSEDADPLGAKVDSHIKKNWPAVISSVGVLKNRFGKAEKYEREIGRMGEEFDILMPAIARLQTLVGTPLDGSKFDLFKSIDEVEALILEIDTKVEDILRELASGEHKVERMRLEGRLKELEEAMTRFGNVGDLSLLKRRLLLMEAEMASLQAGSGSSGLQGLGGPGQGGSSNLDRLEHVMFNQLIPAVKDLWGLYALLTGGPGSSISPGGGISPGQLLFRSLEDIEKGIDTTDRKLKSVTTQVESRLQAVEVKIASLGVSSGSGGTPGSGLGSSGGPSFATALGSIPGSTVPGGGYGLTWGTAVHGIGGAYGTAAVDTPTGQGTGVGSSGLKPEDETRISNLEQQVGELEARAHNSTVSVAGQVFRSMEECELFVLVNVPGGSYGQFFDMISLVQRAWGQNHKGLIQSWEEKYQQKKAGFSTTNEAVIAASFETMIPTPLGENTGKNSEALKPLMGIPTRTHWENNGGMSGKRHDIQQCLLKIKPTLEGQQRMFFQGRPKGLAVARELLSKAERHWSQFEGMLDQFFDEFREYSSTEEAWELCGLIGKTVFEVVYQERCIAADLTDCETNVQRAGRVMWATLQAHRVLDDFAELTYRNHPRVSPVIVLHLLKNRISKTDFEAVKDLQKAQQRAIDKLSTELDKLKRKGGT
jgi:hypothetical protein